MLKPECATLTDFPKRLYTNTLRTIGHILDGALKDVPKNSATGRKEQQADSDTLLHYLHKLG